MAIKREPRESIGALDGNHAVKDLVGDRMEIMVIHLLNQDANPNGGEILFPYRTPVLELDVTDDGLKRNRNTAVAWHSQPKDAKPGHPKEKNGLFVQDVIEIALSRLMFYQATKFASEENAAAIECLDKALDILSSRIKRRESEGKLGTHKPDEKPAKAQETPPVEINWIPLSVGLPPADEIVWVMVSTPELGLEIFLGVRNLIDSDESESRWYTKYGTAVDADSITHWAPKVLS